MRLLKLAATSSLAALVLTLGAAQPRADHDGWWGSPGGVNNSRPRQNVERNTQQNWWSRQYAPPAQAWPGGSGGYPGWFQPQAEVPRAQNIEPEAPAKAPVIYTYRADPLVDLADAQLTRQGGQWARWGATKPPQAVFEALQSGSSGVRVTQQQRDAIIGFYRERDYAPLWVASSADRARAENLLAALAEADAHGLPSRNYLPSDLGSFSAGLGTPGGDVVGQARLELALTAAALRYAQHASGGRIVPDRLSAYHDLTPPTVEGREALTRLAEAQSPASYLASLHPVHPAYQAMRTELADLSARTDRDQAPIADGPAIKPGGTDARVPAIRDRLAKLGHLPPADGSDEVVASPIGYEIGVPVFGGPDGDVVVEVARPEVGARQARDIVTGTAEPIAAEPSMTEPSMAEPGMAEPDMDLRGMEAPSLAEPAIVGPGQGLSRSETYDQETVDAVKAFQAASGLTVDGIIGQQTIAAFNADNTEQRITRLVYNMERLRWMPRDFGAKHVFVNAAGFETQVVENGQTVWSSKVIVGTPQNQTAFFSDQMETVVFNPYWGVPASIIIDEMLPEIYRDPSWLDREGYEVTDLNGRVISSYGVDWHNLNLKNLPIGVRQPPGPKNALGEIKFLFPNEHAIYMHDTPSKPLFAKPMRAYSHGCVRVEKPWEFAEIILGWDQQRVASTRATSRDYSVPVEQEIKVHIAYFTAWPDETGTIRYMADVYGRDELLERALGTLTVAMR